MSKEIIQAIFDDDDMLIGAVKELKSNHYQIEEVFTPFPVHGLEKLVGIANTRIAIMSFIYGLIGLAFAIWMMDYMMIIDWPKDIGGKPSFSFAENSPAFIPIMFELTVFFAAHLMVITFYMRSKLWPFKKAENPDPRTTDDHFMIEVSAKDNVKDLEDLLGKSGVKEIKTKVK